MKSEQLGLRLRLKMTIEIPRQIRKVRSVSVRFGMSLLFSETNGFLRIL